MVTDAIGRPGRRLLATAAGVLVAAVLLAAPGRARADLTCRAEVDRSAVAPGDQVTLTVTVALDGTTTPQHDPPRIDGVQVIRGGTSQSVQVAGGVTSLEVGTSYFLIVERDTDFTIPALEVRAGQQTCRTEPVAITVVDAPPPSVSGNRGAPPAGGRTGPDQPARPAGPRAGRPGDPAFITLTVDRDEVWLGEQVVLVFRYFRYRQGFGRPDYTAPRSEGFWRVDLPPERNYRRNLRGHVYQVTEIRYALFPTRAGELRIGPATLELAGDPFDRIFGRRRGGPRRLQTEPVTVTVRALPEPAPAGFAGLVASELDFTASVDRDTVPRGEPVNVTLAVSGDAFLKGFAGVDLPASEAWQVHDAAEELREQLQNRPRYRATYAQEKAVVPLQTGTLTLPRPELVYFDPRQERYATARAELPPLVVTPSDLPVAGDQRSGFRRTEIARLSNDLAFVHAADGSLRRGAPPLPARPLWWVALLAPWALLAAYRLWLGRRAAAQRDPAGQRRRQAWPRAQRALRGLDRAPDPAALARVITGYVADVSGRTAAGLTAPEVRRWGERHGAAAAAGRLAEILAACDGARFGGAREVDVAALAGEARELLQAVERARPATPDGGAGGAGAARGAARGVVWLLVGLGVLAAGGPATAQPRLAGPTAAPGADPARLLAEGNQAYTEGQLDTARVRYQAALAAGADDAVVHYNLGNVFARQGQLGRAIASYLRAQRRAPRDADIRTNLQWVRSHTRDLELAGGGLPPVIAQLDAAAHRLTVDEWALAVVILAWLVAGLLAWWWRRGWLGAWPRRGVLAAGALLVLVAVVLATRWYEEQGRDTAVVVAEEVAVRSGPASSFPVVFRIHDGLTLTIRGTRDGWARIGLGGDWVGWVPGGTLERVRRPDPTAGQGR